MDDEMDDVFDTAHLRQDVSAYSHDGTLCELELSEGLFEFGTIEGEGHPLCEECLIELREMRLTVKHYQAVPA